MITSSGNQEVDALWGVNFSGNIIPATWYKTVVRENGKANLVAINILADIVYWYRPREIRDEATGCLVGLKKKFSADVLQKTYGEYADLFGISKQVVKQAFDLLEELGVVIREFRNWEDDRGNVRAVNVMYIHLNAEALMKITFTDEAEAEQNGGNEPAEEPKETEIEEMPVPGSTENSALKESKSSKRSTDKAAIPYPPEKYGYPRKIRDLPSKNIGRIVENHGISYKKQGEDPIENKGTYTEITTETTDEGTQEITPEMSCESLSVHPSLHLSVKEPAAMTEGQTESQNTGVSGDYASCEALVKQRIEYDWLLERHPENAGILDSICHCMSEIMAVPVRSVRINGGAYPYEAVKARILKLDVSDIEPLLARLAANTKTVSSSRSYILTALYNARDDNNVQTAARFQHNLAAGAV